MKCKRFRVEGLKNEEWFQFYTEFKNLASQFNLSELGIDELFLVFMNLYGKADEALEIIRKSATTEQIADADAVRDSTFRGFADANKSALNHFIPEKREAAKRVQVRFDHFGNIARLPYDDQTASTYNFLQEMRDFCKADITLLGLTEWVDKLEADNQEFDRLIQERYTEGAGRTYLCMKEIRTETDRCYRDMLDRLDAMMLIMLNAEQIYGTFWKELNERVTRFDNMLATRKGKSDAKKEREKEKLEKQKQENEQQNNEKQENE